MRFWRFSVIGLNITQTFVRSFVVGPHPDHFHNLLAAKYLIDKTVMKVDPPRERARKVANELLEGRRRLEGFAAQNVDQSFSLRFESRPSQLLCVFCSLRRVNDSPDAHQSSDSRHALTGVARPLRIDAR